jgi:hypothetical protein
LRTKTQQPLQHVQSDRNERASCVSATCDAQAAPN